MIIVLLLLAAIAILYWGYSKAKPFGRLGILAWLQTVVLMGPWLLFFGLSAVGLYLNLAGILLLVVISAGLYIYLGKELRKADAEKLSTQKAIALTTKDTDVIATDATKDAIAGSPGSPTGISTGISTEEGQSSLSETADAADKKADEEAPQKEDVTLPPIPSEDLAIIEGIFSINTFFRTKTVPYQEGAIFKGNLRGQPDESAKTLSDKLTAKFGDKYRSFYCLIQKISLLSLCFPHPMGQRQPLPRKRCWLWHWRSQPLPPA